MQIDFSTLTAAQAYFAMTQTVIPRPIAWVLTENQNKTFNLAPYSFFNAISSDPPLLMFSAGKRSSGDKKDSVINLERQGQCVIHIAHAEQMNLIHQTSSPLPAESSEVDEFAVELTPFEHFALPRVKAAPVAFACELYQVTEIGNKPMAMVFVEIKHAFINDVVVTELPNSRIKVDSAALNPLARLGGMEYSGLANVRKPELD